MTPQDAKSTFLLEHCAERCAGYQNDYYCQNCEINAAIKAIEKQIPKKPIMKSYFKDMEEEYLCCPNCGEILTDRIPYENRNFYFHCLNCGQRFDWEVGE